MYTDKHTHKVIKNNNKKATSHAFKVGNGEKKQRKIVEKGNEAKKEES